MSWTSLTPALPGTVTEAAGGLTAGLEATRAALEAARAELRIATALANEETVGALATAQAALGAAVSAVEGAVMNLLDDGGGYLLLVPLPKKGLAALLDGALDLGTSAPTGALDARVPPSVRSLPVWRRAFREEALFLGGNAHFLKTVGEALYDPGDDSRPRFGADTYWAYAVLVGGASDVAAGVTLASYFDRLFGARHGSDSLAASRGHGDVVARGVRAGPSTRANYAVIEWEPPEPQAVDDGEWRAVPTEYAVIRSDRTQAMTARRVLDLFPTTNLREGLTGLHGARVLKVGRCDGITRRYVDLGPLQPNQTYYYHVALKARFDGPERRDALPYVLLSSVARYRPDVRRTATRRGTPPDWSRTPSIARAVPALDRLLDRVSEVAKSVTSGASQVTSLSSAASAALDREIAALGTIVDEVALTLRQLEAIFTVPSAGVHVTLRTGQGNTAAFLADLAQALSDPSDVERPAFDVGDEYVTGAVLLLTGPNPDAFARAWALLGSLLGGPEEEDPIVAGINSIRAGVEAAAPLLTDTPPSVTFNEDMTPRAPGEGDASCES